MNQSSYPELDENINPSGGRVHHRRYRHNEVPRYTPMPVTVAPRATNPTRHGFTEHEVATIVRMYRDEGRSFEDIVEVLVRKHVKIMIVPHFVHSTHLLGPFC
ncbi:hypothetical protein DL766_004168 [Monosporascus sp. MC13-8B]|nr:hypothetical protein DL763_010232 [Monosporascus cannonballus]RYP31981.1 hypothetical protein DL766_004168 [Monosporascus sp. MC13-8B]